MRTKPCESGDNRGEDAVLTEKSFEMYVDGEARFRFNQRRVRWTRFKRRKVSMRKPVFFLAWISVMVTFGVLSGLAAVQAEDCYLDNLKPGLWRAFSENDIFGTTDFVVEPGGLTYWSSGLNIDVDMDCTYSDGTSTSKVAFIDDVINEKYMTCDGNMHFHVLGKHLSAYDTESWDVKIEGNITSDYHISGKADASASYVTTDGATKHLVCNGSKTEYWIADWAEEIGPPDALSSISYPATAKPGETITISWARFYSIVKTYHYVVERDRSPSFEHPTVLYTGKDTERTDSQAGEFVNRDEYQYYYRVKVVSAFGESEWKTGNAVSFCNPEEIAEINNQESVEYHHKNSDPLYYRIYVPPGVSCIRVEDDNIPILSTKYSHLIFLRHQYIPTERNYDAAKKDKSDLDPCTAQVDGRYGYWYIALSPAVGVSTDGNTMATMYDDCSIPYTPREIETNSGYVYDDTVSVRWSAVENAEGYIVELASDDTFKDSRTFDSDLTYLYLSESNLSKAKLGFGMTSKQYFCRVKAVNDNFSSEWRTAEEPVAVSENDVVVLQNNVEAEFVTDHDVAAYSILEVPHGAEDLEVIVKSYRWAKYGVLSARYQYWPDKWHYGYRDDEEKQYGTKPDYWYKWELDFSCSGKDGFWYFSFFPEQVGNKFLITATYTGDCLAPISPANIDYPATDSDGAFRIAWSSMTGVTGYVLERDTKSDFSNTSRIYSGTATSFNEENLGEGIYYYRVRADNKCGNGLWRVGGHPMEVKYPLPPAPVAEFSGSPTKGTFPLTVKFTDQSTGEHTAQYWEFGDNDSSVNENPTHTYAEAGSYTVKYSINGPGGYDIETKSNYIVVESPTLPTVSTANPSLITENSAESGGNVTSNGGAPVTARGVCWSESPNPEISNSDTTDDGTGSGPFTSTLANLTPGTKYYVRAYANNSKGTAYGDEKTFTTTVPATKPTVKTADVKEITENSATGGGDVTSDGGAPVAQRGVCWSSSPDPDINDSRTKDGSGLGIFTSSIKGLTPNTTYHVRAYATNSVDTAYGSDVTFTTLEAILEADFSSDKNTGYAPLEVLFSDQSSGDILSWRWDFGDGTTSTAQNPSHTYENSGNYDVSLTVNGTGGSDKETKTDFVTVRKSQPWNLTKLASGENTGDKFGISVSVSGDYAIVGADGYDPEGAAYIFKRVNNSWDVTAKLNPTDVHDPFGNSVSISEDYAIVGANYWLNTAAPTSFAYIFKGDNESWLQAAKLPPDGIPWSSFGRSVSISGDYAIVGDPDGAAYILKRNGAIWEQAAELAPAEGDYPGFGESVSISGDYAVVGAPWDDVGGDDSGSAYIFKRNGDTWEQAAKLIPGDGAEDDEFGSSVSISGDYAVVGAPYDNDKGDDSGAAYIFKRNGDTWEQAAKLIPDDGAEDDEFGSSVSISGDYAVVGAPYDNDKGDDSGAAYIFKRNGDTWEQAAKLIPADGAEGDRFGESLSVSEDYAIVGAPYDDDNGGSSGSAYVLRLVSVPTVTTNGVTSISSSTVVIECSVSSDGGAPLTARGVCWSTSPNPTTDASKTTTGTEIGSFTSSISDLQPNTTYHVRAYATNSAGTGYGKDISFKTAYSGNRYVKSDKDCGTKTPCHATIQEAVEAAETDSAIFIASGTYAEAIALNEQKSLTLVGGWDGGFTCQTKTPTIIKAPKAPKGTLMLKDLVVRP